MVLSHLKHLILTFGLWFWSDWKFQVWHLPRNMVWSATPTRSKYAMWQKHKPSFKPSGLWRTKAPSDKYKLLLTLHFDCFVFFSNLYSWILFIITKFYLFLCVISITALLTNVSNERTVHLCICCVCVTGRERERWRARFILEGAEGCDCNQMWKPH